MQKLLLSAAAIVLLSVAVPLSAQTKPSVIPEGWLPALSPAINSALQQLKEAKTQAEMNALSREVAEMTDAQLFITYVRLFEKLPAKERTALVAEQTKWLKARAKAARAGAGPSSGSLAPLEANNAELTVTEKRLAELRARLKTAEKKKPAETDD